MRPIITSLLDTDFYKFTMGQLIFHRYPEVRVKYAFKNRTAGVRLRDEVREDDLRRELDHVRSLRFTNSDLHYLRGTNEYQDRMFQEDYLEFLRNLQLPEYTLIPDSDGFILEFEGRWCEAIYWETFALAVISELRSRHHLSGLSNFDRDVLFAEGIMRLRDKIKRLRAHPQITFSDFGTRRRFSQEWQEYVVATFACEFPRTQFLGTSNVYLANKLDLMPMGTSAHEMYMGMSGIMHSSDEEIRASHNRTLQDWWDTYGFGLSIALTDTYNTDFFFKDMTAEQARTWKGLRQDSGDPIVFGEAAIKFYEGHGIDPTEKLIVFSDGLDAQAMIDIAKRLAERINGTFGWGTNFTNDLGFRPISMVVKLVESCGHGTVKLSDNFAKATGDPEDIKKFERIFGYKRVVNTPCRY